MTSDNANLRELLQTLNPGARGNLRRVLIRDNADRDAIAMQLMRYRDENGQRWGRQHRLPDDVSRCTAAGGQELGEIAAATT